MNLIINYVMPNQTLAKTPGTNQELYTSAINLDKSERGTVAVVLQWPQRWGFLESTLH